MTDVVDGVAVPGAPIIARRYAPEEARPAPRFRLLPFSSLSAERSTYLVKGFIPRTGLVIVWGPPKCGKSFWAFDLAMHVALGWEYRGHHVRAGTVVYCALEGQQGFATRVEAFRLKRIAEMIGAAPFYLMTSPLSLAADHAQLIADIHAQLGSEAPTAVFIDTLNRSLAGSESDDRDMTAYIRAADAIREAFGCVVVIIHHCGHEGNRPRGHSALMGALDVQIAVRRDEADRVIAELELSKDGAVGLRFASRLVPVEIGRDEDGDPITSCVIEPMEHTAALPKKSPLKLTKAAQTALRALHEAISEMGAVPPSSNHIPEHVRAVTIDQWRERAIHMGVSTSAERRARNKAFHDGSAALIAAGRVAMWEPFAWPVT
jgi:hypothetical protein